MELEDEESQEDEAARTVFDEEYDEILEEYAGFKTKDRRLLNWMAGNNSIWEVSNVSKSLSVREDRAAAVSLMEHQANKQIAALQKQADLLVQHVGEIRTWVELA